MALEYAHGAIQWLAADGVSTTYTVSGLPFQPKALRFYWVGIANASDAASAAVDSRRGVGFAVSTSSRRCVGTFSDDAAGSAITGAFAANDCVVGTIDGANARDGELDLNAINSDGFQLIVDDQGVADITIFWEAWGGSDISVAALVDIAEPAATGDVDYTVTGFVSGAADQVVMLAGCQSTAALNSGLSNADGGLSIGFATGSGAENIVLAGNSDDASGFMDTDGYGLSGECLAMIAVGGGNPDARASLTQFGTDNFRLNWAARAVTNRRYVALAIKGGAWRAGDYTINGNSGGATATVSGLPFAPIGVSLIGRMATEDASGTSTAEDRIGLGSGSSTSSRRAMGVWDEDTLNVCEINTVIEYDQVLAFPSTAGALLAAYDINAMNSDGFEIIVDTAGGVASEWQGYLAFGSGSHVVTVNQATETDLAQAIGRLKIKALGQASETDVAQAITRVIAAVVGQVAEIDVAQAIAWAPKHRALNQASEADAAQAITARKTLAIGQPAETDSAQSITARKTRALGQAVESDTAQAVSALKRAALGQASETDLAQAITRIKTRAVAQAAETDLAQPVTFVGGAQVIPVNQATETDSAQAIAWAPKHRAVNLALEIDLSQAITALKRTALGQATETDAAQAITARRAHSLGQAVESDTAQAISALKRAALGQASETDLAQAITRSILRLLGQAAETDIAQAIAIAGALLVVAGDARTHVGLARVRELAARPRRTIVGLLRDRE